MDLNRRICNNELAYQGNNISRLNLKVTRNPHLDTLELIAKGLNIGLMLIPNEKKRQALSILNEDKDAVSDIQSLIANPSQGLLGDEKLGDRE